MVYVVFWIAGQAGHGSLDETASQTCRYRRTVSWRVSLSVCGRLYFTSIAITMV